MSVYAISHRVLFCKLAGFFNKHDMLLKGDKYFLEGGLAIKPQNHDPVDLMLLLLETCFILPTKLDDLKC